VDFPDEEIRTILRNVADLFELNLVVPDTLQGKTSIKLRDVTWRQIFEVVLTPVGYTFVEDGNIIKIISNESLQQAPTTTEVFTLNYAKAQDVVAVVTQLVDGAAGGKIIVDVRTNSLVVTEREKRLQRIATLIESLDRATDQVMIETKFIEIDDTDAKNLGVNWSTLQKYNVGVQPNASVSTTGGQTSSNGSSATGTNTPSTTTSTNGSQTLGSTAATTSAVPAGSTSTAGTTSGLTSTATTAVTDTATNALNLLNSITNTASITRASSAVFSADEFGLVFSALVSLGRTKVISNPTIVTLNNQPATISVGESDPIPNYAYNEQRGTFEVSGFAYKDIGIILDVTPQVNHAGYIKLTVHPTVSQKSGTINFGGAGGAEIPIIANREAKTQVSLKDGYTVGIGGLISSSNNNTDTKVPLFGDIPVIGYLFKTKATSKSATNLLIFITAKTVDVDGAPVNKVFDPRWIRDAGIKKSDLPGYREDGDPFVPEDPVPAKKTK
jgi:type IV pilus assembly protein PilQ